MGAVYRAEEEGLGRKVALKVIAPELAQDERFRERFLRESRVAASLDHPHVVPIYQSGEEGGLLFIAMRHVAGTDLAKLLAAEGALEVRRALALLSQVGEALDAAHATGLVHRDVKPSNVLIADGAGSEHCYLADFGLTRRSGSASATSAAGEIVGTLEYIAPEQISGEAPEARSDVYSLGCVLYECLTGQAPFPRATDVALLWAHVHDEPPRLSDIRPELPQELDSAVARALAKNPEERYHSAGELIEACSELGNGVSPAWAAPPTNLPRPLSSFVGREVELAEVRARIEGGARLLTLTGPGGSGKTRLALEVASSVVPQYDSGVFWVGLSALRDPALVTKTIAQTLGAEDGLPEHISEREMLLLLDNLEQVIEVAPDLVSLLERCSNLVFLVTSRELLRVRGEVEYPVPPLAEPEAVELFCRRAQLEPNAGIAELCARLDNLPLAVELAAARTKALTVSQILDRLSQRLDLFKGGRDADPASRRSERRSSGAMTF
jgi:serine/threonine-protein kinase